MFGLFFLAFLVLAVWCAGEFIEFNFEQKIAKLKESVEDYSVYSMRGDTRRFSKAKDDQELWKKIIKFAKVGVLVLCGIVTIFSSFYNVGEQEQAVVTTFGVPQVVEKKGLNFKIPFVQEVQMVDTTIKGFPIGYNLADNSRIEEESLMITGDYNLINTDFYVERVITDPIKYLYASENPEAILKLIAQSSIRDTVGVSLADDVLTTGKVEIQNKIKQSITEKLEKRDIGIALTSITMQDSEPPTAEVNEAFKKVESAKQKMDEVVNNAQKDANEKIPAANAKADEILKNAETKKATRINEAKKAVELFNATYEEYTKNPEVTKKRMFYEAMESILPNVKIVIGDNTNTILPLEKFIEVAPSNQESGKTE